MGNLVLESITAGNDVGAVMYNVTCSTSASTAAKTATAATEFALIAGVRVRVTFTDGNTATNPTLSINSTTATPLMLDANTSVLSWSAGTVVDLIYAGGAYFVSGGGVLGALSTPTVGKGINLLDNWYFPNVINQRGQTVYSPGAYCVDRWYLKWGTATFGSTGVTLVAPSNNGCQLVQEIGNGLASEFAGETITISALYSSVSGSAGVGIALGNSISGNSTGLGNSMISEAGLATLTVTVPTSPSKLNFFANMTKDTTATLVAIKLEKGTQQTLAHQENGAWVLNDPAPNFAVELMKCQRYLVKYGIYSVFIPLSWGDFMTFLPCAMHTVPTIINAQNITGAQNPSVAWYNLNTNYLLLRSETTITEAVGCSGDVFFSAEL